MVRTIERRFEFRSSQTGILLSINDIVQTCTVFFIGYIAPRIHKPRFMSISMLFTFAGMMIAAGPYFMYGPKYPTDISISQSFKQNTSQAPSQSSLFRSMCKINSTFTCEMSEKADTDIPERGTALIMFILSGLLTGLGFSGFNVLVVSYIDDNIDHASVSVYVG